MKLHENKVLRKIHAFEGKNACLKLKLHAKGMGLHVYIVRRNMNTLLMTNACP
jgi:hypothetical protein